MQRPDDPTDQDSWEFLLSTSAEGMVETISNSPFDGKFLQELFALLQVDFTYPDFEAAQLARRVSQLYVDAIRSTAKAFVDEAVAEENAQQEYFWRLPCARAGDIDPDDRPAPGPFDPSTLDAIERRGRTF